MSQILTLPRRSVQLRPLLWLLPPLMVLATLFFYPLAADRRTGAT